MIQGITFVKFLLLPVFTIVTIPTQPHAKAGEFRCVALTIQWNEWGYCMMKVTSLGGGWVLKSHVVRIPKINSSRYRSSVRLSRAMGGRVQRRSALSFSPKILELGS
jgi:hypothetical protein